MSYWQSALAWLALVPMLVGLLGVDALGHEPGPLRMLRLSYLCGVLFYLGNCYWIYQTMFLYGGLPAPVAALILILFSAYLGLYHALFGLLLAIARRSPLGLAGTVALSPFFWVAVELARARVTGFPWDLLGYSQVDNHLLIRLAPWAGVLLISFVVAAGNAAIVFGLLVKRQGARTAMVTGCLLVIAALVLIGKAQADHLQRGDESVVLLQENLLVGAAARGTQPVSARDELLAFSRLSLFPPGAAATRPATVVVWPEAPSHLLANDAAFQGFLGALARQAGSPLIVGSIGVDANGSVPRGYSEYDSAALFDRSGSYQGRYDKIHLVPWGEYVPYKRFFSFAQKLTEGVSDMDAGSARTLFHTDGHRYGIFICYESIFGDEVRTFAKEGAEVLVNISDDGWYGDSGAPWQHLNMARMRAVENDRWLLRATNTGETTVIDPQGNYTTTERHVRTAYRLPFGFRTATTFYTRHGDWFAYLAAVVTAISLGYGLLRRNALN